MPIVRDERAYRDAAAPAMQSTIKNAGAKTGIRCARKLDIGIS
jgi:hypothetical protein